MTHTPTLKPCPFCGGDVFPAFENLWDNDDDEIERCWTVQHTCPVLATDVWSHAATEAEAATAWNTRTDVIEAGAVQGLVGAAEKLSDAERGYRLCHDVKGDGHIETGRAWDYMRKCGDELRTALSQLAEASNA